jgi:hypothetical protein
VNHSASDRGVHCSMKLSMPSCDDNTHVDTALSEEYAKKLEEAKSYLEAKQLDMAQHLVEFVLKENPASVEAHFLAAKLMIAREWYEQAVWHAFVMLSYDLDTGTQERVLKEVLVYCLRCVVCVLTLVPRLLESLKNVVIAPQPRV